MMIVQERHGLLAALVEARDHRGVPGAAAGGLDVACELQVAVEHLREALGDQAAGEPRRARSDRGSTAAGNVALLSVPSSVMRSKQRISPPADHGMSPARIGSSASMTPPRMPA